MHKKCCKTCIVLGIVKTATSILDKRQRNNQQKSSLGEQDQLLVSWSSFCDSCCLVRWWHDHFSCLEAVSNGFRAATRTTRPHGGLSTEHCLSSLPFTFVNGHFQNWFLVYRVNDTHTTQQRALRDAGTGGGAVGATCPHNFEAVGVPPPTLDCESRSFFCTWAWGLYQKIVGQIRGVFSFGYGLPWAPGDVCPPPPQPTSK